MSDVFVQPSGQDDNLGDSALRRAMLDALRQQQLRLHIYLPNQSADYLAGLSLRAEDVLYGRRADWLAAARGLQHPVLALNAGEVKLHGDGRYPSRHVSREVRHYFPSGGITIAAGMGFKLSDPRPRVVLDPAIRTAKLLSWRDEESRRIAGRGQVTPDWAFALGSSASDWRSRDSRRLLAVSLRFDRPWPTGAWARDVKSLARLTSSSIVTVAQVARDAPRAVRLADELGGQYIRTDTTRHDDVDRLVRSVYSQSVAVVSDRAHVLVIGASEGAYPVGSASNPDKIRRILAAAGLGVSAARHDDLESSVAALESRWIGLAESVNGARRSLSELAAAIGATIADHGGP